MIWDAEYFAGGIWIWPEYSSAFILSSSFPAQFPEYISCFRTTSPIKWLSVTGGIGRRLVCRIVFMFVCLLCCFHFCNCEELYSDKGILFLCSRKLSVPGFSVCVKRNPPARPVVFLLQKENPPFGGFSLKKAFFVYFFKTTTPGSSFPSIHSRKAPPAVEM